MELEEQFYPFPPEWAALCPSNGAAAKCLGIFNMREDVDACDCTQGLHKHRKRVCSGSWLWEKNPLPHGAPMSALCLAWHWCQHCAWLGTDVSIVPGFSVSCSTIWAVTVIARKQPVLMHGMSRAAYWLKIKSFSKYTRSQLSKERESF